MKGQAELREAGAKVQLSQSERALFPVPEMDAAAQSMGNWTGSKERATFKAPSDTGGVWMWSVPCLWCQKGGRLPVVG